MGLDFFLDRQREEKLEPQNLLLPVKVDD